MCACLSIFLRALSMSAAKLSQTRLQASSNIDTSVTVEVPARAVSDALEASRSALDGTELVGSIRGRLGC